MSLSLVGIAESLVGGVSIPLDATEGISVLDNPGQILDEAVASAFLGDITLFLNADMTIGGVASTGTAAVI